MFDLHEGILEEFVERAAGRELLHGFLVRDADGAGVIGYPSSPERLARRAERKRVRIRLRWTAALAEKVCRNPKCGARVVRPVKPGPIPDYCSKTCRSAAKWARWYEAHRAERLARCAAARRAA